MSTASFSIAVDELGRVGRGLARPENVLCFRDGTIFASSNRGHVTRIDADGRQEDFGDLPGGQPTTMALDGEQALLVNNTADGCLYRLYLDGRHELVLDTVDGRPIGSANHVFRDAGGRTWIAVATRRRPPHRTIHVAPDGYIAVMDADGVRVVADGLRWPNEVRLDARECFAYVPETFAGRVLRFAVTADGGLAEAGVFGPDSLGDTAFPDGIALDADGNVWVAVVSRNGLMVLRPDGQADVVFEQPVPAALEALAAGHRTGSFPSELLERCAGPDLKLLTSVGFVGPELRTIVMGSLGMSQLVTFPAPVAGLPLAHQHRASAPTHPTRKP